MLNTLIANDTIFKLLADLNQKVGQLELQKNSDTIIKWLTLISSILIPIIVGFILFILNKKKEFTIKKSEIAGNIYGCMWELKIGIYNSTLNGIDYFKNVRLLEMLSDPEINWDPLAEDYNFDNIYKRKEFALVKMNEADNEINNARKELTKSIGQYRFYLRNGKKTKFDVVLEALKDVKPIRYDFSKIDTFGNFDEISKLYSQNFNNDIVTKYKPIITGIEKFIDEN